jgi:predicted dehydrogenase
MSARVAVIGCGWWSTETHLPALSADERATVVALVDPDAARLAAAAARFGVEATYADVGEMLERTPLDAAVIAVPHSAHYPVAKTTLERRVHTLLEKPMTIEPAHARELIEIARAGACELLIGYPWHYNRQVLAIRELLARGELGPIEHVACLFASVARALYAGEPETLRTALGYTLTSPTAATYSDPALAGGGQGQTQVTHTAALLLWMTGLRLERLVAFVADRELEVDLVDAVALAFEGGALGTMSSTGSLIPEHEEVLEYRIFCRDGFVMFDVNAGTATIHTARGTEHLPELPPAERYPSWEPVRNLVDIACGARTNGSPGEIGLASVEFVDAIYRSARAQSPVPLDPPSPP